MRPILIALTLFTACASKQPAITSQQTSLTEPNCRRATDPADPNDTPYLVCPGPAGYTLSVRQVESGRTSIDIVDPAGKATPLNYHQVITPSMFALSNEAEWRIEAGTPIALITTIRAHEDPADPAKTTNSYVAVARITPGQVCVTDKLSGQDAQGHGAVQRAADSARTRPCLPGTPNH